MTALARPAPGSSEKPRHAPQLCPRCHRANPADAAFCYFDGVNLAGTGTGLLGTSDLGRDFLFPSGRRCRTFDQLVVACSEDWGSAKAMLKQGSMRQFLAGVGRVDLAVAADRAAGQTDGDLGLDQLLSQFPTSEETRPKLDLAPRRLHLPALHAGEQREFTLTIVNQGARLLHGDLKIEAEPWLRQAGKHGLSNGSVAGASPTPALPLQGGGSQNGFTTLPIKTGKKQQLVFEIDTTGLPAGQRYAGKLTLLTSGGVAEVPVSVDVVPVPFSLPPLTGAATPRELAAGMKEVPKQVYPLLENGLIREWFQKNGWQYPVTQPQARGIAAVQQFFEALGLSKPPPLRLEPAEFKLTCRPAPQPRFDLTLSSDVKKWLYARADADKPWVRIIDNELTGPQNVRFSIELQTRRLTPGKSHAASVTVTANGEQRFSVPIHLDLEKPSFQWAQQWIGLMLIGVLTGLFLRLLAWPVDAAARTWAGDVPGSYVNRFVWLTAWLGPALAALWLWRKRERRYLPAGLLVGSVTGLAIGATLANLLQVGDSLISFLGWPSSASPLLGSFVSWGLLGLAAAFLLRLGGTWGQELLARWSQLLVAGCRRVGLGFLANLLAVE